MISKSGFKREFSMSSRVEESSRVLLKYPDRKPVICEKSKKDSKLPDIDKKKYLVHNELSIGQFIYVIRKRMNLRPEEAIFLFINNKIISTTSTIQEIYYQEKDEDGFLYIEYAKENVFG